MKPSYLAFLLLLSDACVDRINFNIDVPEAYPVVVSGVISDAPGPYYVEVTKAFDIQSKASIKQHIAVKKLTLSDNVGTQEVLTPIIDGYYQTDPEGIQGVVGRVYTLRIELLDGRVYESLPDTLLGSGALDRVYFTYGLFSSGDSPPQPGFDVYFDATTNNNKNRAFLWSFNGTYLVDVFCCKCWVDIKNPTPFTSDQQLVHDGQFTRVKAGHVPVTANTFMYKVRAQVTQYSLSRQSLAFWKAVQAQAGATTSLFQPITGKVPSNFTQLSGPISLMQGIFYASSFEERSVYITRNDLPNLGVIPKSQQSPDFKGPTCRDYFPYSTSTRPSWWID